MSHRNTFSTKSRFLGIFLAFLVLAGPLSIAGSNFGLVLTNPEDEVLYSSREITDAGITIIHCYLPASMYAQVRGTYRNDYLPGYPDCIGGVGDCSIRSTGERVVYHPAGNE